MKFVRKITLLLYLPAFFVTAKTFSQNPGDSLFNTPLVHEVNILVTVPGFWNLLLDNETSGDQNGTNPYIPADVVFNGVDTVKNIGLRLKGNSSMGHPGQKKPVKLKFNEYVGGQTYDGLKQLEFSNGFWDPSMMREKLFLDFLNRRNITAPRCTYAKFYYNGNYVGIYEMIEPVDKIFLDTRFQNNGGNLFSGDPNGTLEYISDSQEDYYAQYELKTNEIENDWSDLLKFIKAVNDFDDFDQRIEKHLNTQPYLQAWAANNLFVNLDSYMHLAHNYFLYDNKQTDKFDWITWDVSLAFGVFPLGWNEKRIEHLKINHLPIFSNRHPLNVNFLYSDKYRRDYFNYICDFLYNDFTEEKLFPQIDSLANIIRPLKALEPDSNQQFTEEEFEGGIEYTTYSKFLYDIPALKSFITNRRNNVVEQLCEQGWSCYAGMSIRGVEQQITNVFPNPTTANVTVKFLILEPNTVIDLRIVDLLGRTVYDEKLIPPPGEFAKQVNLETLPQGMYMLYLFAGCQMYSKKVVVYK